MMNSSSCVTPDTPAGDADAVAPGNPSHPPPAAAPATAESGETENDRIGSSKLLDGEEAEDVVAVEKDLSRPRRDAEISQVAINPSKSRVESDVIDQDERRNFGSQVQESSATTSAESTSTSTPTTNTTPTRLLSLNTSKPISIPRPTGGPRSPSYRTGLRMPNLVDLTDLTLHSPSSQIVGTPFAITTNTTRFEYPFPDTAASGSQQHSHHPHHHAASSSAENSPPGAWAVPPSLSTFSLGLGGSYPSFLPPPPPVTSSTSTTSFSSNSGSASQSASPVYGSSMPDLAPHPPSSSSTYNSTNLKLNKRPDPPIPPSLAKKRNKWSLNLLGRRRSSTSAVSTTSTTSSSGGEDGSPVTMSLAGSMGSLNLASDGSGAEPGRMVASPMNSPLEDVQRRL
ncbi:hypothetical protein CPC08DRAFT_163573 [Agrocybe pediades]|nr:hypothetical protein CPC08DRAFT_163573 [Agrocybe pediades]